MVSSSSTHEMNNSFSGPEERKIAKITKTQFIRPPCISGDDGMAKKKKIINRR